MILAGDIGGTKTHLAIFEEQRLVREEKFPSKEFHSLSDIIRRFNPGKIEKACFGVAGPVQNGRSQITNLSWVVDAEKLSREFKTKVSVINDLEASAWGINRLKPNELATLNAGEKKKGNAVVVSAGTGLGVAGLYWDGAKFRPFASEGGHANFGPHDSSDIEFWHYLHKKYGHVSWERVVAGPGIEHLYWFLVEKRGIKEKLEGENLPRIISEQGVSGKSKICREVLERFASLYGNEAGNLALTYLAVGGVYLGGGIAPKILPILKEGLFMRSFVDKGRFQSLLEKVPINIILNENTALLGAAEYALNDRLSTS